MKSLRTKLIFLIVALVVCGILSTPIDDILERVSDLPPKEIFKTYHYLHQKTYPLNSMEGLKRYKIFKKSLKIIEASNAREGKQMYGMTPFLDITREEFIELGKSEETQKKFLNDETDENKDLGTNNYNSKWENNYGPDFNHMDEMPPVVSTTTNKSFGSWAWTYTTAIEYQFKKKTGKSIKLSEQYLWNCMTYESQYTRTKDLRESALKSGVVQESVCPYTGKRAKCTEAYKMMLQQYKLNILEGFNACRVNSYSPFWNRRTGIEFTSQCFDKFNHQPFIAVMDGSVMNMQYYRPGKDFLPITTKVPAMGGIWECNGCGSTLTVLVVGKITENGEEYWIIRNTYGPHWGYKGYMKLRIKDRCNIDMCAEMSVPIVVDDERIQSKA